MVLVWFQLKGHVMWNIDIINSSNIMNKKQNQNIKIDHGGGGYKSLELLKDIRKVMNYIGKWKNTGDDAAVLDIGNKQKIVFTTDGFIVNPIFFPGGDIGKIAISGTINDLSVMGAKPLGLSLSIIIEEGFAKKLDGRVLAEDILGDKKDIKFRKGEELTQEKVHEIIKDKSIASVKVR